MKFLTNIYDYLQEHKILCFSSLLCIVILLVFSALQIDYKEEITDFLPVDDDYQESMRIYQEVTSANKIVLEFSLTDTAETNPNKIIEGVEQFTDLLATNDTLHWLPEINSQVDYTQITDIFEAVYKNLPYYIEDTDYARIDSILSKDSLIADRLNWTKDQLASPVSSMIEPMFTYDPLGFGTNLANLLRNFQPELNYKQIDGYIFTKDSKICLINIESPFGGSETAENGKLINLLEDTGKELEPMGVKLSLIGAPVIAVTNATQIKHDSTIAVIISVVLILALLLYSFRNFKSLILIAIATGFGFLFALGMIGIFKDDISLIVVGIASIIIGIAVNYPLHYVCHLKEYDYRTSLKDLFEPLIIGNITTVGAFLTLVPLEAVAIRDLGLFSAFMLIGTIIFVLIWLPQIHIVNVSVNIDESKNSTGFFTRLLNKLIASPITLVAIIALTIFFGYFSLSTKFDTNMNHINYMTSEQKAGMSALAAMRGEADGTTIYVTTEGNIKNSTNGDNPLNEASKELESVTSLINDMQSKGIILSQKNPIQLLPSQEVRNNKIKKWQDFWKNHNLDTFTKVAKKADFTDEAFAPFIILCNEVPEYDTESESLLSSTIFNGYVSEKSIIAQLSAKPEQAENVENALKEKDVKAFDLTTLNSKIANTLSNDFNYIGFACGFIVFIFLWITFRNLSYAIIAFLPMAIGWLWILGIMQLLGISFNIVNIILATFIFGQGDDYTIFITEGLIKDYKNGSNVLVSYQKSILLSALIMLIGIGSLIISKHPAMHSLAEVTIIGMVVVVLMAWVIPPLCFHYLRKIHK